MANKAIKYRIYPTEEQCEMFSKTFGCCRKIWNLMLDDKIECYNSSNTFGNQTPAMYKEEYPYLKEVDSLALANVQLNLQRALKNCFDKKRKTKNGFPNFKSAKHSRKSYTTNNQRGTVAIIENRLKLPKVGEVPIKIHRIPNADWVLKSATISQDADGKYYASILFEFERKIASYSIDTNSAIGLDYASDGLYVDSNGNQADMPHYYRSMQKKLAKEQHRLSRKQGAKKGVEKSNNYKKQQLKVAKIHKHIANQRLDYLHKLSTEIANQYDVVCVESLNMRAMANKGFGNGKATLDNGYGMFLNLLEYKLTERGKKLIKIDKWYPSSQICSCCGSRQKLLLSQRTYCCPSCGIVIGRDYNAAINIKKEGLCLLTA